MNSEDEEAYTDMPQESVVVERGTETASWGWAGGPVARHAERAAAWMLMVFVSIVNTSAHILFSMHAQALAGVDVAALVCCGLAGWGLLVWACIGRRSCCSRTTEERFERLQQYRQSLLVEGEAASSGPGINSALYDNDPPAIACMERTVVLYGLVFAIGICAAVATLLHSFAPFETTYTRIASVTYGLALLFSAIYALPASWPCNAEK